MTEHRAATTSTWEWIVAGIGALIVAGAVGSLLYEAAVSPDTPPAIEVEVLAIHETGHGFLAELVVRNHGHETAATVGIEGTLRADTGVVETAETTLDYVPARAERKAGLFFTRDPRRLALRVRPRGYEEP